MIKEDYALKARKLQSELERSKKFLPKSALATNFLNAANYWRSSLKQNLDSKRMIANIKIQMEDCYNNALFYAEDSKKKRLIQQEKNYSQLFLKEVGMRNIFFNFATKYRMERSKITKDDLKMLSALGTQYRILASKLDIPEQYISSEKKDLELKSKKIDELVMNIRLRNDFVAENISLYEVDGILSSEANSDYSSQESPQSPRIDLSRYMPQGEVRNIAHHLEERPKLPGNKLENLAYATVCILSLLTSLFFISMSVTGNVIGGIVPDTSRILGLCLFVCGLVFTFIYLNKRNG